MYVVATALVKLSICIFLFRFTVKRAIRDVIYVVITVVICFSIFLFFFALFQCRPVSEYWRRAVELMPQGSCMDPMAAVRASYAHSAIITAVDWTLGILPIVIVWNTNQTTSTKLYIALVLGLGSLCVYPYIFIRTLSKY